MSVPDATSLRKTLCMLTMTKTKVFLRCCSAKECSTIQFQPYGRGREQTYLWYTLHFIFTSKNFQVPPFLQQSCWAWPKVQLPSSGSSFWAKSAGSIHPHAPLDAAQRQAVPNRSEWCTASTGISHRTINQPERTGHLSWQSLMDQVIQTNFRKSQLFLNVCQLKLLAL